MSITNPSRGLSSTSLSDLVARNFNPRQLILAPWLRTEETCILWSASGVGKTMFSLSIALAVAGGGKLADWKAPTPRRVLYIDGEMNLQDVQERMKMLMDDAGILTSPEQLAAAGANLVFEARQDQELGTDFYDLTDERFQKKLIERVVFGQFDLLILDNFTTLSDDLDDENDATAFKKVQDFFLQLKRVGVATILVHHANKGGKQMRGSTALATTFEVVIGLTRPKVASPSTAKFLLEFGKFRSKGDSRIESRTWTLEPTGWHVSDVVPDDPNDDSVLVALRSLEYCSNAEIAVALGMHRSTVKRRLERHVAAEVLRPDEIQGYYAKARRVRSTVTDTLSSPNDVPEVLEEEW